MIIMKNKQFVAKSWLEKSWFGVGRPVASCGLSNLLLPTLYDPKCSVTKRIFHVKEGGRFRILPEYLKMVIF